MLEGLSLPPGGGKANICAPTFAPRLLTKGVPTLHRRKYDTEFKIRVAREAIETGNSTVVARRFEIAPVVVSRWVRSYKANGFSAFDVTKKSNAHQDHNLQLHQVEQENEQLKKILGEKDLEIAILRDLVKKGTRL